MPGAAEPAMIIRNAVNAGLHVVAGIVMGSLAMLVAAGAAKRGAQRKREERERQDQTASTDSTPPPGS